MCSSSNEKAEWIYFLWNWKCVVYGPTANWRRRCYVWQLVIAPHLFWHSSLFHHFSPLRGITWLLCWIANVCSPRAFSPSLRHICTYAVILIISWWKIKVLVQIQFVLKPILEWALELVKDFKVKYLIFKVIHGGILCWLGNRIVCALMRTKCFRFRSTPTLSFSILH